MHLMYYVILNQPENPSSKFFGFIVQRYIAAKNTNNVIFEVKRDGKTIRKWINKEEIILLTDDKAYFVELMHQFKEVEAQQIRMITDAQKNLDETLIQATETINAEIESFEKIRYNPDVHDLLKDL